MEADGSFQVIPDGWFKVQTHWPPLQGCDWYTGRGEEWVICGPGCFVKLADITGERLAERMAMSDD